MAQLRRRLPPANSLVVLEAAGRHLNFTRAGEELALTQSAVSRQIQLLEQHLGAPMFQRQGRHLQLTRDGRAAAPRREHGPRPHRRHRRRHPPPSRHRRAHRGHQRDLRLLLADGAAGPVPRAAPRHRAAPGGLDQVARSGGRRRRHRDPLRQRRVGGAGGDPASSTTRSGRSARRPTLPAAAPCPASTPCSTRRCSTSASSTATG